MSKPCLIRWLKGEEQRRKGRKGSEQIDGGSQKPFWPDVEERLVTEFKELRRKGLKMKYYWFENHAQQLMSELHPDANYRFSQGCIFVEGL